MKPQNPWYPKPWTFQVTNRALLLSSCILLIILSTQYDVCNLFAPSKYWHVLVRDPARTQITTPWVGALDLGPPGIAMRINEFQTCFQALTVMKIGPEAPPKPQKRALGQNPDTCEKCVFAYHLIRNACLSSSTRPDSDHEVVKKKPWKQTQRKNQFLSKLLATL